MIGKVLALMVAATLLLGGGNAALAYSNVALGKTPTLILPDDFGTPDTTPPTYPLAATSTLTDGFFLANNSEWQEGTVWWTGPASPPVDPTQKIKIDLGGYYVIDKFGLQADCNDTYVISAYDGTTLKGTATFGREGTYGMMIRPDFNLPSAITVNNLVLQALVLDDHMFAVSEIQAFGDPVPLPGAVWLLGSGLGLLAWRRRRS